MALPPNLAPTPGHGGHEGFCGFQAVQTRGNRGARGAIAHLSLGSECWLYLELDERHATFIYGALSKNCGAFRDPRCGRCSTRGDLVAR